ncbi:MAG TPA: DNA topoisomerase IB, partial [Gemmataceae bacterium]|nr:DNA topoisomerase IB [Gemmataceae bacterium]
MRIIPLTDPIKSAKAAGLQYVTDDAPGIQRIRRGKSFHYLLAHGRPLRARLQLQRIRALVIPPAWTHVWICPKANGHLQATGRDARGRKQYLYHSRWRQLRDQTKFDRMVEFGRALPGIRKHIARDLRLPGLQEKKVLAAVVQLLEMTHIRVGSEEYVHQNHSYGLTTLRTRHVEVAGATMRFEFRGKGGVRHLVEAHDRRLAEIVKRCQDLPGQELFQYLDDQDVRHTIGSAQVNDYVREISSHDFTAKDFRTWSATVIAVASLRECGPAAQKTQAKRNVMRALRQVAERLGNT